LFEEIKQETETKMQKSIEALRQEMKKLRTGRAHPSILEGLFVEYYGSATPLNQVASVTVSDPRTLSVTPFDKSLVNEVDKAIRNSEMGLNPVTAGEVIRVPLPPLTEERRKEMIRIVRGEAEQARVSIRNIRRDANNQSKELQKEKVISEDDERRASDEIQKLTNKYIAEIDAVLKKKEEDLMEL